MNRLLNFLRSVDRRHALAGAGITLLPFLIFHRDFSQLFWFGDEWDLLDQIDQLGFRPWTTRVFAENFVPLFKLLWGGTVFLFGGSYMALLTLLWLTHALNTVLLGRLLRHAGFGWTATLFSQAVFALVPHNLETLGWGVQWSAVLAVTFMLGGLDVLLRRPADTAGREIYADPALWLTAASALSFSRGVLTGGVLWLAAVWSALNRPWYFRGLAGLRYLFPGFAVAGIIMAYSSGNHRHMDSDTLFASLNYARWYFSLNPFHALLSVDSWGPVTTTLLAGLKATLIAWGLIRHTGATRRLLFLLLIFDLGNALLLGVGRHHTGLGTTVSSRYQYGALLATLPFAGLWLESLLRRLPDRIRLPGAIAVCLIMLGVFCRQWPSEIASFCDYRGTQTRQMVFTEPNPPARGAIPGIPSLPTARARELAQKYHLH